MSLFSGKCEGGPLDGKILHHGTPVYRAHIKDGKIVTRSQHEKNHIKDPGVIVTTYEHADGRWTCEL